MRVFDEGSLLIGLLVLDCFDSGFSFSKEFQVITQISEDELICSIFEVDFVQFSPQFSFNPLQGIQMIVDELDDFLKEINN